MKFERVIPANSIQGPQQRITFDDADIGPISKVPRHIQFWQMLDRIAAHYEQPPLCPCGERPHRIFCPLGFDKYFLDEMRGTTTEPS